MIEEQDSQPDQASELAAGQGRAAAQQRGPRITGPTAPGKQARGLSQTDARIADGRIANGRIAGFDAGQTHTSCRLATAEGKIIAEGEGPGVCHLAAADGPERFQAALSLSLADACRQIGAEGRMDRLRPMDRQGSRQEAAKPAAQGVATPPLLAAAVGASGIEQGSDVQELGLVLAAAALGLTPQRLKVTGDERTALRGAFPNGPGIVVISGTGTIAVGRDGKGREHRCAGWGWLLDGAGSALDIGRDGLSLSLQMADGRLAETPLRAALWQALAVDAADPQAAQMIKALVVRSEFGPAGFARLAPVVAKSADSGDPQARAILRENGTALAASVAGVAKALGLAAPPVAALGGALTHLQGLRQAFVEALSRELPGARLQEPLGDACSGALALAGELVGRTVVND